MIVAIFWIRLPRQACVKRNNPKSFVHLIMMRGRVKQVSFSGCPIELNGVSLALKDPCLRVSMGFFLGCVCASEATERGADQRG